MSTIAIAALPHTFQKYPSVRFVSMMPFRFISQYDVKNDSGRNTMVTEVKTNTALFCLSAM